MSSEKLNILFLQTINPGVCYYRMLCFAQKMSQLGLARCRLFPEWDPNRLLSPDWERKLKENLHELEAQTTWADVVVCQYINSPEGLSVVQAIKETRPCIMEVDDYFKQVPYQSLAYDYNAPGDIQDLWATRQMIESSAIIVSTPWLRDQYLEFNKTVKVIPNCIDFDLWDSFERKKHDLVRVGWIGGATHGADLKMIKETLYEILKAYENAEVYIVSSPPPEWSKAERMHLIDKWVTMDYYARHVKELSFDIGLVPLRDNLFNRGKSNLRFLEYSACKIPTVASMVEPFKNDNHHCKATDDSDWLAMIGHLVRDISYRHDLGQSAYEYVKTKYNLENVARDYAGFLKEQT